MLKSRNAANSTPAYHPPLAGREGLRLDFNENTIGPSPRVLARLRSLTAEDLARYPERQPIEALVAKFLGINEAELLLTNGVDEAIHLLCQTYLDPGDEALIVVPTYSMYRIYMAAAGAKVVSLPADKQFQLPHQGLRDRITDRTRLIAIANPNNPTGTCTDADRLLEIARLAPQAAILVDEAYYEFCGKTILPRRQESPNIFITRTFSKAYGLAGLRVGVLVGDSDQMPSLRRVCSPYNVNAIALACLPQALADQNYIEGYVGEVLQSRARLQSSLQSKAVPFWPSQANFVLARIGSSKSDSQSFVEQMRRRGILVRDRSADYACEGCVRFTLGSADHTTRLLSALDEVLEGLSIPEGTSRS
jgi:histidinol-phosphate aminotransferase